MRHQPCCLPAPLPTGLDPDVRTWLVAVAETGPPMQWPRYYALATCADAGSMTVIADRETWQAGGGGRYFPVLDAACRRLAERGFLQRVDEGPLPRWRLTVPTS